jgi:hypothetical protein
MGLVLIATVAVLIATGAVLLSDRWARKDDGPPASEPSGHLANADGSNAAAESNPVAATTPAKTAPDATAQVETAATNAETPAAPESTADTPTPRPPTAAALLSSKSDAGKTPTTLPAATKPAEAKSGGTPPVELAAPKVPAVPGGVWEYKAPEQLLPGQPREDLKPTLAWLEQKCQQQLVDIRQAYGMPATAGPQQAIALRYSEGLAASLRNFVPPPYRMEKVAAADGSQQDERISALVFAQFVYDGKSVLFVFKQRMPDGELVAAQPGAFLLVPGRIQEHTVVLDTQGKVVREPATP